MATGKITGNHLKILVRLLVFSLAVSWLAGCAALKKQTKQTEEPKETQAATTTVGYDESFDPLSLEDDDIVIKRTNRFETSSNPVIEPLNVSSGNTGTTGNEIPDSLITYKEVDGFRVQIFAGRSVETATMTKTKAEADFAPLGQKVYFIFEAPFYRIRVGDFTDRTQAEKLREQARKIGYREAFIVRSKVRVPENLNR